MNRWLLILAVVGSVLTHASIAGAQGLNPYAENARAVPKQTTKAEDAFAPMPGTAAKTRAPVVDSLPTDKTSTADAYRIGPQDVLEISVFGVADLSGTLTVGDNGTIQLPLVGETPAAGKTVRELQRDLAAKLGSNYLQNPQVTVSVKEYNSRAVILSGQIEKPGVYPLKGETTLLQLVASAGGFKEGSDSTVLVLRKSGDKHSAAKFDVSDIEKGRAEDPIMQAGDTVVAGTSVIKKTYQGFMKALPVAGLFALF